MSNTAYSLTKLNRPSASKTYMRKRLFRLLDSGRKKNAIWVCGPPGAGKTTLVNSYVESRGLKCLWYQVDEGDRDLSTFFHYMGLAAAKAAPRKRARIPHLTPEYLGGLGVFTRGFFQKFFGRLLPGTVVVLDNFQEADCPGFNDAIAIGIREVPKHISLILVSRNEPPPAFARGLANREMGFIGWDDLRLTEDEARGMARLLGYKKPLNDILVQLQGKAQGWAAGLLLMLERSETGLGETRQMDRMAIEAVFNYFMAEFLDKASPESRDFLLKTCQLPQMTIKAAEQVSGSVEAGHIIDGLRANNFFIEKRFLGHEEVYQYHPLFREFLMARAQAVFKKDELAWTKTRSAEALQGYGRIEDAARLFIEAGDHGRLSDLILTNALPLLTQGRFVLLESWIGSLPDPIVSAAPWLLYFRGLCRLPFNPAEARKSLEGCYSLFKKGNDSSGAFLTWAAIIDTFMYEWKDFKPFDHWIKEFEGLVRKYDKFPSPEVEERAVCAMFSALAFRQPHHPDIQVWERRAEGILQNSKNIVQRVSIGHTLVLYNLWTGNIAKTGVIVGLLTPLMDSSKDCSFPNIMLYMTTALYNCYVLSYKPGLDDMDKGLEIVERTGIHLMDMMLFGIGVYLNILHGEVEKAAEFVDRMRAELNKDRTFDLIFYHHMVSIVDLHKNNMPSALENGALAIKLCKEGGMRFQYYIHLYMLAYIEIEAGKFDNIKNRISELREAAKVTKSILFEYVCTLLEALVAFYKGDDAVYLKRLKETLCLGKKQGFGALYLMRHTTMAQLLSRALEEGFEPEYVKKLIALGSLAPFTVKNCPEEWPWPVKVYTFGRFEIYLEGKKMEFKGKVQQKPLALLKELISQGGKLVHDEVIMDALWPDSEGDLAYRSFTITLHRLRKLLGNDKAIIYTDGMVSLHESCFWVDAWAFSDLIVKIESITDRKEAARLLEKAVRIYRSEYLPGEDLPSVISCRERLRNRYLKCVDTLGRFYEEAGDIEKAIDYYKKGLVADELAEGFYKRIMHCCTAAGYRVEAIKTYNRLKAVLSSALGIPPSPEVEDLYLSILKNTNL